MVEQLDVSRSQPMYTIPEAARLAHVSPVTVRRWLYGYMPNRRQPDFKSPPVFTQPDLTNPFVSFLQLVEIVVAADFRKLGHVKLDVVRKAYETAQRESKLDHPFAHVQLESLGGHIVQWMGIGARAVDQPNQYAMLGLVSRRMEQMDYVRELAARWHPAGKDVPVVVDPLFSSGVPTIEGRGVTVNTIYKRWKADQPIEFIADDLEIDTKSVERALRYADKIAA